MRWLTILGVLLYACAGLAGEPPVFVGGWGEEGTEPHQFDRPRGIDIDAQGVVYTVDDMLHRVQKFDRSGSFLGGWGQFGNGPGEFDTPLGIAVDDRGHVYVVDTANFRIQKFTTDGDFVLEWGGFGTTPGLFTSLRYAAVDSAGNVFVSDAQRVQKFTSDGDFMTTWGSDGLGEGQFRHAFGIAVAPDQTVYVGNTPTNSVEPVADVQRFTNDGVFMTRWGTFGEFPGQFMTLIGIDTDSHGNVHVVDHHNFRIQTFSGTGELICAWGSRPDVFVATHDLAFDANDDLFIIDLTNQAGTILHYSDRTAVQGGSWSAVKDLYRGRKTPHR